MSSCFAVHNLAESPRMVSASFTYPAPATPGELLGHVEGLRKEFLNLAGRANGQPLSSSESSSMPRMAMISCRSLYRLENAFHGRSRVVVVVADYARIEDARSRGQRIDGRIDAPARRWRATG